MRGLDEFAFPGSARTDSAAPPQSRTDRRRIGRAGFRTSRSGLWHKGDLNDITALGTAAGYCDVVISENHWGSILRRHGANIASLAAPLWRLLVMVCSGVGTLVAALVLLDQGPATLGTAALPLVVAYALGVGLRDRISMLEERTRHLAEAQQATAARERERIAREIHDIVAHPVSLMVVQAEAGLVLATDRNREAGTFETTSDTGRETLTQLDRALGVLRGNQPARKPNPAWTTYPTCSAGHA